MKNRWSVNWLIIITAFLLLSAFIMLILSYRENKAVKSCSYAGVEYPVGSNISDISGKSNCICGNNGEVVCDDGLVTVSPSDFSSNNMNFESSFISLATTSSDFIPDVTFVDISQKVDNLTVVLERMSMCNVDGLVAPQTGFYKQSDSGLVLTIATNLLNESFNTQCVVRNSFKIYDIRESYPVKFNVSYQDEYNNSTSSNNCVYEGKLRNDGDVFLSKDKCSLCTCHMGLNRCELEESCLDNS